jgi:hypothetical protein
MKINLGGGLTRILIVVIVLFELVCASAAITIFSEWYDESPFDRFDVGYTTIYQRLEPIGAIMAITAIAGYVVRAVVGWIARGFTN